MAPGKFKPTCWYLSLYKGVRKYKWLNLGGIIVTCWCFEIFISKQRRSVWEKDNSNMLMFWNMPKPIRACKALSG